MNDRYVNLSQISQQKEVKSGHIRIFTAGSEPRGLNVEDYSTQKYLFKEKRKVFFTVSSGLCNLQCPYCITERPGFKDNLDKDDFSFIFKYFGQNIYFIFSGWGDFFCGYSAKDQLLRFLLQHDVAIFLDINGVDIKELSDQDLQGKEKIDMIDISYHFGAMKKHKVLNRWVHSIKNIHDGGYNYYVKMIPSPLERDIWEEAILFYEREVLPITGKKLMLFPDTNTSVDLNSQLNEFEKITANHQDAVSILGRESLFKKNNIPDAVMLPCPAGSRYFRISYTGEIVPCEFLAAHFKIGLGNLKRKEVITLKEDVLCNYTGFCDCGWASNPRVALLKDRKEPYPRRILYEFESKLQELSLPQETDNITVSIDRLEEDAQIVKNMRIEGWAFINGTSPENSNCYIILKSDKKFYIFDSHKRKRPDVTAHFKTMNLDDSGFFSFIPKGDMEAGQYKIGIYIKKGRVDAFQYTDKIITVDSSLGILVGQ